MPKKVSLGRGKSFKYLIFIVINTRNPIHRAVAKLKYAPLKI